MPRGKSLPGGACPGARVYQGGHAPGQGFTRGGMPRGKGLPGGACPGARVYQGGHAMGHEILPGGALPRGKDFYQGGIAPYAPPVATSLGRVSGAVFTKNT